MASTHPTGNALGGRPARQNWGKFDAHKWGGFNARSHGQLKFFNTHAGLADKRTFKRFIAPLRHIKWVVYCKAPFAGPEQVLRYLSRYTHRVAISNRRLVAADHAVIGVLSESAHQRSEFHAGLWRLSGRVAFAEPANANPITKQPGAIDEPCSPLPLVAVFSLPAHAPKPTTEPRSSPCSLLAATDLGFR